MRHEALSLGEVTETLSTSTWKSVRRVYADVNRGRGIRRVAPLEHSEEVCRALRGALVDLAIEGLAIQKPGRKMSTAEQAQINAVHSVDGMYGSAHGFEIDAVYYKRTDADMDSGSRLFGVEAVVLWLQRLVQLPQAA